MNTFSQLTLIYDVVEIGYLRDLRMQPETYHDEAWVKYWNEAWIDQLIEEAFRLTREKGAVKDNPDQKV